MHMCLMSQEALALCTVSSAAEKANVHIPVAHHDFAFGWSYCNPEAKSVMSVATGGQSKLMFSGYVGSGSKSETRHAEPTHALSSKAAGQQRDAAQYLPRLAAGTLAWPISTEQYLCAPSQFHTVQFCTLALLFRRGSGRHRYAQCIRLALCFVMDLGPQGGFACNIIHLKCVAHEVCHWHAHRGLTR